MSTPPNGEAPPTAIESAQFPFEQLSDIAELESWRKEVHRPVYHMHKWWAQRLGTVFRAILLGAVMSPEEDIMGAFFKGGPTERDPVVFDPFMGSGTTIGEALKLGFRAIGRDINPVAYFSVKTALTKYDRATVMRTFEAVEKDVAPAIQRQYRAKLPRGGEGRVLYYFWVKTVSCLACASDVRLFSRYVFAQHAYPRRYPQAQIVCPGCGNINVGRYDAESVSCSRCGNTYGAADGPVRGGHVTCPTCSHRFPILAAVRRLGTPPNHELYAKLVLDEEGQKEYLPADDFDRALYAQAATELAQRERAFPLVAVEHGYNTKQAMNYGYAYWHQFFNARQLLCLSILGDRIRQVDNASMRDLFLCLFSGTLEFNNMFASYKGEGTGAVRHMFSHHVLKPQRTPLEANVWGTPKSSGAFSTLFRSRLLKALDYQERPFEIAVTGKDRATAKKYYGLSAPMGQQIMSSYAEFSNGGRVYLSVGDSASTDLPDESVDLIVTDPPFFDNVHYSELADFFYVWQRHFMDGPTESATTTRHPGEVQSEDAARFADKLAGIFIECRRVLRRDGLLVFTYHHSRVDGWTALDQAIRHAGFRVVAAHPIKSEMSGAAPKRLAGSPIDVDVILVCRRRVASVAAQTLPAKALQVARARAAEQVERLAIAGRSVGRNDRRVILMAQLLVAHSGEGEEAGRSELDLEARVLEEVLDELGDSESALRSEARRSPACVIPRSGKHALVRDALVGAST